MTTTHTSLARHLHTLIARQAIGVLPDRQLLETFLRDRSEASFAALVHRHGPMVLSVCRRVLHNSHDAEDAFQAAFLIFARKAGSIRKHESVSSWLHGVAYRVAEKLRAKAARRAACERNRTIPPPADVMEDITWRELRRVLDEELRKLPEQYRAPLVLCYLEGKTRDEAARQLDWSKAVFRRRLERGRDLLGRLLSRRGVTLSAALCVPLLAGLSASAAPPAALAATTVRAGLALAAGLPVSGLAPARVLTLAAGERAILSAVRTKLVFAVLALSAAVGGIFTHQLLVVGAATPQTVEAPLAAPKSPAVPSRSTPPSTVPEQGVTVRGRVLGPDGKPVAGAKVYVSTYSYKDKTDPKVRAETDAAGRFRFMASRVEADVNEMIAAVAPGYGPDWASLKEVGGNGELALRLVMDDVPIRGRVLDLEGRPIAGVTARVKYVKKITGDDLTPWLQELQAKPNDRDAVGAVEQKYERRMAAVWGVLGTPKSVKTGVDGRFQLRGFGRDRIVELRIEGPGIEHRSLTVMTRAGLAKGLPPHMRGPAFDYLAGPNKPIRGTVREKGTGKPLAGVSVNCQPAFGEEGEQAITDKEGRYEIPGIRKSEQYHLGVGGLPIISFFKEVGDTPGLEPIRVDFEVERALVLQVRVTEKGTGKPVRGLVQYAVRSDNRSLDRYTTYPRNVVGWDVNQKDGTYKQVVLPGRGYIAFRATQERYTRARLKAKENSRFLGGIIFQPLFLETFHAVVPINPSADDPKSLICDIVLDRGQTLTGTIVDPEGRPLSGAMVCGLHAVMSLHSTREADSVLATPSFTATGLEPRYPRGLVFYHAEKKLAKMVMLRGDEKGPLTVRLEPLGAITGRLVDAKGKPRTGIELSLPFEDKQQDTLPGELLFSNHPLRGILDSRKAITDKDGRFRFTERIAGLKYELWIRQGDKYSQCVSKGATAKAGVTADLGEIKMQAPSEKGARQGSP